MGRVRVQIRDSESNLLIKDLGIFANEQAASVAALEYLNTQDDSHYLEYQISPVHEKKPLKSEKVNDQRSN